MPSGQQRVVESWFARGSSAVPMQTAEEIVAGKVARFGRSRHEMVREIARRRQKEIPSEVDKFFEALEANVPWLTTVRPSDWLADHPPIGRAAIPPSSYAEMKTYGHRMAKLCARSFQSACQAPMGREIVFTVPSSPGFKSKIRAGEYW